MARWNYKLQFVPRDIVMKDSNTKVVDKKEFSQIADLLTLLVPGADPTVLLYSEPGVWKPALLCPVLRLVGAEEGG